MGFYWYLIVLINYSWIFPSEVRWKKGSMSVRKTIVQGGILEVTFNCQTNQWDKGLPYFGRLWEHCISLHKCYVTDIELLPYSAKCVCGWSKYVLKCGSTWGERTLKELSIVLHFGWTASIKMRDHDCDGHESVCMCLCV